MVRRRTTKPAAAFAGFSASEAAAYDAWYDTPAGSKVARAEERRLLAALAALGEVRTLLDAGSGSGYFARAFARVGLTVTAVEPSVAMVRQAVTRGGPPAYLRAVAEQLPLATGSVDAVTMVTSLEFMVDQVEALCEAARVARRGLVLGVLNRCAPVNLRRAVVARFRPSPFRQARFLTPWGLERLVRRALGGRVAAISRQTVLWPARSPRPLHRLPFGALIVMTVRLRN